MQDQALAEKLQELTAKVQENTQRMEAILADFGAAQERPSLVLVKGGKDGDDA
jgi:hypothetical protein